MPQRMMTIFFLFLFMSTLAESQTPDPHSIPAIDAALGSCSANFTITDSANAPIYNATIKVRIAYGTWSIRKLDLEVATNVDGKARFTGLPNKLKRGLYFEASQGDRQAESFDDVNKTCTANFTLALQKQSQPSSPPQ
jgi:hypothetical protein